MEEVLVDRNRHDIGRGADRGGRIGVNAGDDERRRRRIRLDHRAETAGAVAPVDEGRVEEVGIAGGIVFEDGYGIVVGERRHLAGVGRAGDRRKRGESGVQRR